MAHGTPRTLLVTLTAALTAAISDAFATTFYVTSLEPTGTGSLAAAITSANSHAGPDVIQVGVQGTVVLDATGLPVIVDTLTVQGSGAYAFLIDGAATGAAVFQADLAQGDVLISDLSVSGAPQGAFEAYGAGTLVVERASLVELTSGQPIIAAYNNAELSVSDSVIADNLMSGGDAAIDVASGSVSISGTTIARNRSTGAAAGLYTVGADVTIDDVAFSANINSGTLSDGSAGAFYGDGGTLSISHSRFSGNEGYAGGAVAITGDATLDIDGSTFSENSATTLGGALRATGANTILTITDSSFLRNSAGETLTTGGGAISMSGGAGSGKLSLTDSFVSENETAGEGGGVIVESVPTVTLTRTGIAGNSAYRGSGLSVTTADTFTLMRSTISGNTATQDGAGLLVTDDGSTGSFVIEESTVSDNASSTGPAVSLEMTAVSTIDISRSTFSGNTGTDYGAIEIGQDGGDMSPGSVEITNSTFSGNTANATDTGILFGPHVAFIVEHSTFVDNAGDAATGVQVHAATRTSSGTPSPAFNLDGSVLASVNAAEIRYGGSPYAASSEPMNVDRNDNIVMHGEDQQSGVSATGTTLATSDPLLGALADNGGYTQTHLPAAGSPAINGGPDAIRPDNVDQRGVSAEGNADLGAVEAISNQAPELVGDFEKGLSGWVGRAINVDVVAQFSDPDGDGVQVVAVYGLPDGLTFDAGTGLITGSATQAGSYNVTIEVTDDAAQPLTRVVRATVVVAEASSVRVRRTSSGGAADGLLLAMMGLLLGYRCRR